MKVLLLLTALLLALTGSAGAAGLTRPNAFSPLGIGIGGAGFAGIPNPATVHYNPAGLTLMPETVAMAGLELVLVPLRYTPIGGAVESTAVTPVPVPSCGLSSRFAGRDGREPFPLAAGLGFFASYAGALEFPASVSPGMIRSSLTLLEVVPSVAYQVTRKLSLGLSLRIGFGLFDLANTERAGVSRVPADLSGFGLRVGFAMGAWYAPVDGLRLGLTYAGPMPVAMSGRGEVEMTEGSHSVDRVNLEVPWPQWAALGFALALSPRFDLYLGARWTDWSSFQRLVLDLTSVDVVDELDLVDGISAHLGAEWQVLGPLTLRAGFAYDSNTVSDEHIRRQYMDANKFSLAVGLSWRIWSTLTVDFAYEFLFAPEREVPERFIEERDATGSTRRVPINGAPGTYSLSVHSLALGLRYSY